MALTLNQFIGFETGGLEEATSTAGTPEATEATVVRSGIRSLKMDGVNDNYSFNPLGIVASGGTGNILGFAFYTTDKTPSGTRQFVRMADDVDALILNIQLETNGDVVLLDNTGSNTAINDPFTINQWHYIELFWEHSDSGSWELFVDGTSVGSGSSRDMSGGGTLDECSFFDIGQGIQYFDDVYWLSGATSISDRLGGSSISEMPEVFGYQNTAEDATDQGDTLDNGTWALVSETPLNEGTSNDAFYDVGSAQKDGHTVTDEGSRSGPSGDANIDGDSNIKGGKWIHRLKRESGSGVDHVTVVGHNGNTSEQAVTLGTGYGTFFYFSVGADLPTSSETFAIGFGSSSTGDGVGGRDPVCGEQWAMLLHVPSAAGLIGKPLLRPFAIPRASNY